VPNFYEHVGGGWWYVGMFAEVYRNVALALLNLNVLTQSLLLQLDLFLSYECSTSSENKS